MIFKKKVQVEKYLEEFKEENMKNRKVFYDASLKVKEPEEIRSRIVEYLGGEGFYTVFTKTIKIEDLGEFGEVFEGTRLKPFESVTKAVKEIKFGVKHKLLLKIFLVIGFLSLAYHFLVQNNTFFQFLGSISLILVGILFLIRDKIRMDVWIKIIGIYNPEEKESDVKLIIAGDLSKKIVELERKLEDSLSFIYQELVRKYIRGEEPKIVVVEKEAPEMKVIKELRDVEEEIKKLDKNFIEKKVSEDTYKKLRGELEERKRKYEILLELMR